MSDPPDICHRCGRPILEGEPRYTLGEFRNPPQFSHYDCKEREDQDLKNRLSNFRATTDRALETIERLRRSLK